MSVQIFALVLRSMRVKNPEGHVIQPVKGVEVEQGVLAVWAINMKSVIK
jgi:hypothetical protein